MITEEQCTEKTCLFCASDYHLEMILLPYIKERIDKNKIIIILSFMYGNKIISKW